MSKKGKSVSEFQAEANTPQEEKAEVSKDSNFDKALNAHIRELIKPLEERYEAAVADAQKKVEEAVKEAERRFEVVIANMSIYVCFNCSKDLISGKDPIYTSFDGHKFCSNKCIEEKKNG